MREAIVHYHIEGIPAAVATELERLRAENAALRAAIQPLARIPFEEFNQRSPSQPLMGWNNHILYIRDVIEARRASGNSPDIPESSTSSTD